MARDDGNGRKVAVWAVPETIPFHLETLERRGHCVTPAREGVTRCDDKVD